MTLTVSSGGRVARIHSIDLTYASRTPFSTFKLINFPHPSLPSRTRLHVVSAAKNNSSQTGRFDSKKRRTLVPTTTTKEQPEESSSIDYTAPSQIETADDGDEDRFAVNTRFRGDPKDAPKFLIKDLPGLEPDPFEGPQWDGLGFFVQYLWAFGIVFALVSGGIAAGTYNEGATDFKETPVYKEAMESRDLLDEAEGSSSEDVFESNPTEVAPTLE
ncbi:AT-rich interactive domain protein [Hirschfeldia incana]|nr:AT-rich interactive domain protein [Hirschfeldia incana]